jgi:hypothetical protein
MPRSEGRRRRFEGWKGFQREEGPVGEAEEVMSCEGVKDEKWLVWMREVVVVPLAFACGACVCVLVRFVRKNESRNETKACKSNC